MLPITLKRFNAVDWKKLESHVSEQDESLGSAVAALNTQREILRATTERTENILSQYYKCVDSLHSLLSIHACWFLLNSGKDRNVQFRFGPTQFADL
jgi:hypothetical protein